MPAKRTSANKAPTEDEAMATASEPAAGELAAGELAAEGGVASGDVASDEAEVFVPANRAERRAHGKGKAATQPNGRGGAKVGGGHGPAQAQRMWTNRRSGG